MRKIFALFILLWGCSSGYAQDTTWSTYFEKSNGTRTPRYNETMEFCRELASASQMVMVRAFGESGQGRKLPLLIIDKEGKSEPDQIRASGRILVLVEACIHPGEPEGKDAGLMLIRDIVINKKYPELLDKASLLFIPIFNVDGHERFGPFNRINQNGPEEMGWRVTPTGLNLNRDFLKADAPEMQNWLRMFSKWMPEFFIDTHTTDGADYQYTVTYHMNIYGGMDENLTNWTKNTFLKNWSAGMERSGYPVFPYVEFRSWHDPKSGIETGVAPPMLSQGYTSLHNRPGLLIETHMLKPYRNRVYATYECLLNALRILHTESGNLRDLEHSADQYASGAGFRKNPFPLTFKTTETDSTMVDFLGIRYSKVKSDITGDNWYKYGNEKETFKIPFFGKTSVENSVILPEAYIIPVEWRNVIERIRIHGIRITRLTKDTLITVSTYRFSDPQWQNIPYEGRHPLRDFKVAEITEIRMFPAGSAIVDLNQPSSRIIAQILEPKGDGSYVAWGFFDAIFEQKEYAENYVMEEMAKKMLSENAGLKAEFEAKKQADTSFAKNPRAILNWFFSKTPYWDPRKDIYPVGRIMDRNVVEALPKK